MWPFRSRKTEKKSTRNFGGGSADMGNEFITQTSASYRGIPIIPVDESAARNSSIVSAIVWWGMRNIVQAVPMVKQDAGVDGWKPVAGHPCAALVRKPQAQILAKDRAKLNYRRLLRALFWSLVFDGNGYALKVRGDRGNVIGLDWIPHGIVTVVERENYPSVIEKYELRSKLGVKPVDPADMMHFTWGIEPAHPACGCSPLKSLMRLVMTDNQIVVFSHAVLRNPFPGLAVTPPEGDDSFTAEDVKLIVEQMAQVSTGERGGGVVAFTDAMKIEKIGYSPNDMAVREFAKLPEERIAAVFGIPPMVLGFAAGLDRSTMANMEQAFEAACENFLVPLWDDLAETFTEDLLPEFESDTDRTVFVLDYSGVKALQEDADDLHTRVRENFKANLIDRAAAKSAIGITPGKEDEGVYFYQLRGPMPEEDNAKGKATARARRAAAEEAA